MRGAPLVLAGAKLAELAAEEEVEAGEELEEEEAVEVLEVEEEEDVTVERHVGRRWRGSHTA